MLALFTNLSASEFILVLVVAVLIFGRRLPEVAAKGAVHLQRLRRGMQDFRRESGFDEEIRRARRLVENPIKGALEEADKAPAAWRPASPRVAPHPDAVKAESTGEPKEAEADDLAQPEAVPEAWRPKLISDEEPDAHS